MSVVNRRSSLGIGRRTRVNVLEGKTIRKLKDGGDVFEDYWTDSGEENSNSSSKSSHFFSLSLKSQNVLSNEELSDFSDSDHTKAVSELVSESPKSQTKLSKSGTKISLPLSSSKSFHINRISSISAEHSIKSVRNLDKDMIQDMLQHNSPVSNNEKDELDLSSVSTPNKNSETAKSLEKIHVKTKSVVRDLDKNMIQDMLQRNSPVSNNEKDELVLSSVSTLNKNSETAKSLEENHVKTKSVVRDLDKEMIQDMLQHNSSVSNNKKDELVLSSVSAPNKNSETAKSLEKIHVKTKNSLEMQKILSNYDKYDALIMQMIQENNDGDNSSQHLAQNISSKLKRSGLRLNDNDLTNNLSHVDNIVDEYDDFDQPAIIGTGNRKAKSSEINSLERKNSLRKLSISRGNEISGLPSRISPDKINSSIKEMQIKLNASRNKSYKMKNKEFSQRMLNVSDSVKEMSGYVTLNKGDSSAVENPIKSNSLNLYEISNERNFQKVKPKKIDTKNKREALRNRSSCVYTNEYDSNVQEHQNKSNPPLKLHKKRKCNNEKCSSELNVKNTAKSSIGNKKQKIVVDETNSIPENESIASDHELHMNDIASEQELLSDISESSSAEEPSIDHKRNAGDDKDKRTLRRQNSNNLSPEQEHLNINSNANALSSGRCNVGNRRKHSTELKDTENKIIGEKEKRKSQHNLSNHHGKQISVQDLSVEKEQLASVSDDYSSPGRKRKQPLESRKIKIQSRNRKSMQILAKSRNHELQHFPVDDLSPVQKLPLSNSFDNQQSPEKNVSKKKYSPAKSEGSRKKSFSKAQVRRSNRQRYPPLARWRNQRLLYRFEKGEIKIVGIDEGIKEDENNIQQIYPKKKKDMKIPRIKKVKLFDTKLQKQVRATVYKTFQSIPWVEPVNTNGNSAYRMKRIFETTNSAFGYLEIDGFEMKPPQHMPEEDLQLTVVNGEVEIIIQDNNFKPQKRDMFIIPRGTPYSIKNINKTKALLTFSVGRFKLLEKGLVD